MAEVDRVVFRMSPLGVLAALAVAACATPFALGAPWFFLIYLVPIGIVVWVLRTRTVADAETVTTRSLLTRRRVGWDDIASLRLRKNGKVAAVLTDGGELALHAVRVRDLPVLAAVSGGRLPDPEADRARE
jgi:Bacterial PH domain